MLRKISAVYHASVLVFHFFFCLFVSFFSVNSNKIKHKIIIYNKHSNTHILELVSLFCPYKGHIDSIIFSSFQCVTKVNIYIYIYIYIYILAILAIRFLF